MGTEGFTQTSNLKEGNPVLAQLTFETGLFSVVGAAPSPGRYSAAGWPQNPFPSFNNPQSPFRDFSHQETGTQKYKSKKNISQFDLIQRPRLSCDPRHETVQVAYSVGAKSVYPLATEGAESTSKPLLFPPHCPRFTGSPAQTHFWLNTRPNCGSSDCPAHRTQ